MATFQNVYEEYAQPVYRFLLSLTGNDDFAEELLSETFYQAFIHIDQFEGRCSLYTWLCQIGKNAWIKECRRNNRYSEITQEDLKRIDDRHSLEDQIINKEQYYKILKVLHGLSDIYRDVFILHAIGEVKLKEIACIKGTTSNVVPFVLPM